LEEKITWVIQINGKVRASIETSSNIDKEGLKELILSEEKIKGYLKDKTIQKFIIVPQKLVNIVI